MKNWTSLRRWPIRICLDSLALLLVVVAVFWKLALTNLVIARGDVFTYFYPYLDYAAEATRQGRLPLWNPYLFMGAPFLANSQAGFFYPLNRLLSWLPVTRAVNLTIILHAWLAGLGAYAFGQRSLGLTRAAAWTSGVAFAIGGYLVAQVEHVNQLHGLAWLAWLFVWFDLAARPTTSRPGLKTARPLAWIGLAATVGLQLLSGHTQSAFISLVGLGIYALLTAPYPNKKAPSAQRPAEAQPGSCHCEQSDFSHLWRAWVKQLATLAGAMLLGAGLAAVQLIPTIELTQHSIRSGGLGWREAVSFSLKPALLGRALLPTYMQQAIFPEYIAYLGVAGLALSTIGLMAGWHHNARLRAMAALAGLGIFFALGIYNPVYILLVKFVPGFGLFRVPARWLILYAFGAAMSAGVGFDTLLGTNEHGLRKFHHKLTRSALIAWCAILIALIALALYAERIIVPGTDQPTGSLGPATWAGWLIVAGTVAGLGWTRPRWSPNALVLVMLIELFAASLALPFNRATAPEALTSLRPPILNLKSEISDSRFLSLSDIFFDPGDKVELESAFADQLSPDAFYDLLVATKQKEIIGPNLPLYYRLPTVDGFDGGILPLQDYVTFQRLFVPPEKVSPDGRLREALREVPDGKWLSLMNVRYIITDKTLDAWIDDVFYDLQFNLKVADSTKIPAVARVPRFEATALGVVSHLQGATQVAQGSPVAQITVGFEDGTTQAFTLRAGVDTAEGVYRIEAKDSDSIAHQPAQVGGHFVRDHPEINDYVTRLRWDSPRIVTSISVEKLGFSLVIRGASLIDERSGSFQSLAISRYGQFARVYSGDVKIYEKLDVLPRAFVVPEAAVYQQDEVLEAMRAPAFDPARQVMLSPGSQSLTIFGNPPCEACTYTTTLALYRPEHVIVDVEARGSGWLVLTDAYYPGWRALVDGQQAPIARADLLFRAVPVPKGTHRVEFVYEPLSLKIGGVISLLALSLVGFTCLVGVRCRLPIN